MERMEYQITEEPVCIEELPLSFCEFTDLNEYCLLEILSYLNFTDLLALSEVNDKFRDLVKIQLPKITFDFVALTKGGRKLSFLLVEKIFCQFGHLITKLKINAEHIIIPSTFCIDVNQKLLKLIGKFCSNGRLRELTLIKFRVLDDKFVHKYRRIFHNLRQLSLKDCSAESGTCIRNMMDNCWQLKKLKFSNFRDINFVQAIPHCQLETLILKNCGRHCEMISYQMLKNQSQLKCFKQNKKLSDPMRIPYEMFIKFIPNIESLSVNWFNRHFIQILELPNLREFQITVEEQSIYAFNEFCFKLARTNQLEALHVKIQQFTHAGYMSSYKTLAKVMGKFSNLRYLHLDGMSKLNPFLNYVADELTTLKELHISFNESLETFNLVAFIEKVHSLEHIYLNSTPMIDLYELFNQMLIVCSRNKTRRITVFLADHDVNLSEFKEDFVRFVHFTGKISC